MNRPDNPREHADGIRPEATEPEDDNGDQGAGKPETDSDSAHQDAV